MRANCSARSYVCVWVCVCALCGVISKCWVRIHTLEHSSNHTHSEAAVHISDWPKGFTLEMSLREGRARGEWHRERLWAGERERGERNTNEGVSSFLSSVIILFFISFVLALHIYVDIYRYERVCDSVCVFWPSCSDKIPPLSCFPRDAPQSAFLNHLLLLSLSLTSSNFLLLLFFPKSLLASFSSVHFTSSAPCRLPPSSPLLFPSSDQRQQSRPVCVSVCVLVWAAEGLRCESVCFYIYTLLVTASWLSLSLCGGVSVCVCVIKLCVCVYM